MKTVTASPGIVLQLGRQGENNARQIVFDITSWKAEFGADGTAALLAQRPGETEPYPVDIVVSGSAVTWLVSAADTAKPGIYGQAELQYRIGDVVVKSAIWRTFVADSLGVPSPEPPEPQQAWVDQVLNVARQVETAVVNGPKIQDGTWWVWDFENERYVDTGVQVQGKTTEIPVVNLSALGVPDVDVLVDTAQATVPVDDSVYDMLKSYSLTTPVRFDLNFSDQYEDSLLSFVGSGSQVSTAGLVIIGFYGTIPSTTGGSFGISVIPSLEPSIPCSMIVDFKQAT